MGFSQRRTKLPTINRRKRGVRGGRKIRSKKKTGITGQGIFNLSGIPLTSDETAILDKGLKFAPPKPLNKFQTYMDIHKYTRRLNIKRYLLTNPINTLNNNHTNVKHSGLANASLFNPPGGLPASIKVFRDLLLRDLESIKSKNIKMSKDLESGLDQLCKRKDLVVRPADKGGGYSGSE